MKYFLLSIFFSAFYDLNAQKNIFFFVDNKKYVVTDSISMVIKNNSSDTLKSTVSLNVFNLVEPSYGKRWIDIYEDIFEMNRDIYRTIDLPPKTTRKLFFPITKIAKAYRKIVAKSECRLTLSWYGRTTGDFERKKYLRHSRPFKVKFYQ